MYEESKRALKEFADKFFLRHPVIHVSSPYELYVVFLILSCLGSRALCPHIDECKQSVQKKDFEVACSGKISFDQKTASRLIK